MNPKIENVGGQLCVKIKNNEYIPLEQYYEKMNKTHNNNINYNNNLSLNNNNPSNFPSNYYENNKSYHTVIISNKNKNKIKLGRQNNNAFDFNSNTTIKISNQINKKNHENFEYNSIFNNWDKLTNTRIMRINKSNKISSNIDPYNYNYSKYSEGNKNHFNNKDKINNINYTHNFNYENKNDLINPTAINTYNNSFNNNDWNNFNIPTTSANIQKKFPDNYLAQVKNITNDNNQLNSNEISYPSYEDINSQFSNLSSNNQISSIDQQIYSNFDQYLNEQNQKNPIKMETLTQRGKNTFPNEQIKEKYQKKNNITENKNINNINENKSFTNINYNQNKNDALNTYESTVEPIQNKSKDENNKPKPPIPVPYYFHLKGLDNIGSTCYMNTVLQCLLHVNELICYFLNEYPRDCKFLNEKNNDASTQGNISKVFYELIKNVYPQQEESSNISDSVSPENFQKTIGDYNPQFKNLEANDSKDLILYLMQSMHSELNYNSKNKAIQGIPNQYDRGNTFHYFINSYDIQNYSIISAIFYGTCENITKCTACQKNLYNFQKFEFISFGMINYVGKEFNIYNGFEDNQKIQKLTGDNQFYCNNCKKLNDAETYSKIIVPPNKLLINIDYGKNKKYIPNKISFDEEIDITKYVIFDFGTKIKYRLIGVCTHFGESGLYGHYAAFCKNLKDEKWYNFNDSMVVETDKSNIYSGTPYLLLYEKIQ